MARLTQNDVGEPVLRIDWGIEDVRSCLEHDDEQALSDDDCVKILHLCGQIHDANVGMNWSVIQAAAFYYMAQKEVDGA
jgi:hypothetical protein